MQVCSKPGGIFLLYEEKKFNKYLLSIWHLPATLPVLWGGDPTHRSLLSLWTLSWWSFWAGRLVENSSEECCGCLGYTLAVFLPALKAWVRTSRCFQPCRTDSCPAHSPSPCSAWLFSCTLAKILFSRRAGPRLQGPRTKQKCAC